jgi:hypothetical protein
MIDPGREDRRVPGSGPWRVFLSHTSDLREHPRDRSFLGAAEAAVIRAGHAIADMAYFAARDGEPAESCTRMVARTDVYVGIIGLRYGAPVRGRTNQSYTELEFETATSLGLPRLVFLVRDDVQPAPGQSPEIAARQAAFRNRLLEAELTTAWVTSPADLEIRLHQSLVELEAGLDWRDSAPLHQAQPARGLAGSRAHSPDLLHTVPDVAPPMVALWTHLEQPEIGDAIALLREQFRLTRSDLVQRMWDVCADSDLGVDTSLVYRWEKGDKGRARPRPGPRYRRLLGMVCDGQVQRMNPIGRREFLNRIAMLAGSPLAFGSIDSPDTRFLDGRRQTEILRRSLHDAISGSGISESSVSDWEQTVLAHGRATRDRPSEFMLADLTSDLADLRQALDKCRSSTLLRRLARVSAQMAGLMCLTLCKLDERDAFRNWARTACAAAQEAGDPVTYSWVRAQEAFGHFYAGDITHAIEIAQHAQTLAGHTACVGGILAAALEARAHAALGRPVETRAALGHAEAILAKLDADCLVPSAFGYSEAQLRFHESNALTNLRDTKAAWAAQERALALTPNFDYTDRALTHLDRATCLVHEGDISGATTYATQTLTALTGEERLGIITGRARRIFDALPPHAASLPTARDLRELLMGE